MAITAFARLPSAAASTNATVVSASPIKIHSISGLNAGAAARYVKLYNKATSPTVGTDVPFMSLAVPVGVFSFDYPIGVMFPTGLGFALTTGAADSDTGALTSGDILGLNIGYA